MENQIPQLPQAETTQSPASSLQQERQQKRVMALAGIVGFILIAAFITGVVILLLPSTDPIFVARLRDVFIIVIALMSLLISIVMVILILQIAVLTNLLKNEIKPILDSTNETVSTLRGTASFISDNLAEPVIKLNEYIAAVQEFFSIIRIGKKKP
jgi:hypothetical protein